MHWLSETCQEKTSDSRKIDINSEAHGDHCLSWYPNKQWFALSIRVILQQEDQHPTWFDVPSNITHWYAENKANGKKSSPSNTIRASKSLPAKPTGMVYRRWKCRVETWIYWEQRSASWLVLAHKCWQLQETQAKQRDMIHQAAISSYYPAAACHTAHQHRYCGQCHDHGKKLAYRENLLIVRRL